jgi:hypothetical protein
VLAQLLQDQDGEHPRQIARAFRNHGAQLTPGEKRALGLRSNAALTREGLAAFTEKGRENVVAALESTLLDAMFSFFREVSVAKARAAGVDRFRVDAVIHPCNACIGLHGQIVSGDYLAKLPPAECGRDACGVTLIVKPDFLGSLLP